MKTPAIIGIAAVAVAAVLGGSAVAVAEIGHPQPTAAVKAVPAPTKTIIKHKTRVIHDAAPAPAQAAPAAPVSSLRPVGEGVYAGASTSDAFALNVADSWNGYEGTQEVYSPATGQTYAMTYQMTGPSTVTATGGNGALVQFPG